MATTLRRTTSLTPQRRLTYNASNNPSNDELLDYAELNASHHESISTKLLKLEDLNNKWTALMKEDANEILRRLDQHNILLQEEFQRRGITHQSAVLPIQKTTPKSTSENTKSTHTISFASSSHQSPFFSTTTINDHLQSITNDNPTLNYFDASLLTRLELPSFAGNILEFPEFWAHYRALIHCKNTISDATKLSLLKTCLKGRALHAIDGLPLTNENYTAAIDILLSIYDNPSTLRHLIYTQLQSLPQCDSDGKQLQELYLAMLRLVRQYTAITPDSPEFGLGALLYNKPPRFVKARIYDITGGQKNHTPSELVTILADIVRKESPLRQIDASTASHQLSYHISCSHWRYASLIFENLLAIRVT
uniref:Nuclear pore protein n=1 Tax=Haemonchus contortus TaxID=6289 RepID=A0A7I4YMD7_HAECO